jgi:hypothetical protein
MGSRGAFDEKIECPICLRRAAPKLRAVASGVLTVCPYCLSPYLPAPRGHSSLRTGAPELTKPDGRRGTQASSMASRDDA